MKNFRFQPVAWMTSILAVLDAVIAANELYPVVPESWTPMLLFISAALTAVLGRMVWSRVTPLADPHAANGRELVPTPPARIPPGTPETSLDATVPPVD